MIGLVEIFILFALSIGLFGSIFWIWMIIDCATQEANDSNDKLVWTIIVVFTHFIGAAIYYFVRRPARIAALARQAPDHTPLTYSPNSSGK